MAAHLRTVAHPAAISANEVETLVLKAARGGGLPLGCAEDLAAAARYLDLDALTRCPCSGEDPDVIAVQTALDFVMAGEGPQTVEGDRVLIHAYVLAAQTAWGKRLVWSETETGAIFERFDDTPVPPAQPLGRRTLSPDLAAHLSELAARLLVPETDASRLAGAGAGLTDND